MCERNKPAASVGPVRECISSVPSYVLQSPPTPVAAEVEMSTLTVNVAFSGVVSSFYEFSSLRLLPNNECSQRAYDFIEIV